MNTLKTLFVIAALFTFLAWISLQGVSNATIRKTPRADPETAPLKKQAFALQITRKKPEQRQKQNPPAPKPRAPSRFQIALEAADLCEVSRLLGASLPPDEAFTAIVAVMNPSPALQEAFGPQGVMIVNGDAQPATKPTHSSSKLYWALRKAGLLYGPTGSVPEDKKLAREILLEEEKKNPGNGFYPLFRLYLEEQLGFDKAKLQDPLEKLRSATLFDTGLSAINREFRETAWSNPAMHYAFEWLYSAYNPAYYGPTSLLKRLADEGDFDGSRRVGELMMESGLRTQRSFVEGDYDHYQYIQGRTLHPDLLSLPDWQELEPEKQRLKKQVNYSAPPWITDEVTGEKRCDPGPYESYFYELRENR